MNTSHMQSSNQTIFYERVILAMNIRIFYFSTTAKYHTNHREIKDWNNSFYKNHNRPITQYKVNECNLKTSISNRYF